VSVCIRDVCIGSYALGILFEIDVRGAVPVSLISLISLPNIDEAEAMKLVGLVIDEAEAIDIVGLVDESLTINLGLHLLIGESISINLVRLVIATSASILLGTEHTRHR